MKSNKVFLIGEIGINHNGSLKIAKELILFAKNIGFDAVKFQKRTPEITTPKDKMNKLREMPWGGTDHAASLEKNGMISFVNYIRRFEKIIGNGKKKFLQSEKDKLKENKYW